MKNHGRILCITSNYPRWPGDSTTPFVLHLAQDLQSLGWKVDVLAPHAPGAALQEMLEGVRVERFRYLWPESMQTVCYQGGALINLRKRPLDKLKLPVLVAAEFAATLRRLLSRRYDILHSHWILPQGFTGMLTQRFKPTPHVITVHGGDIFGLQGRVLDAFKRSALYSATAVTVNSSSTQRAVEALAPQLRLLEQIPMGVSTLSCSAHDNESLRLRQAYRADEGPLLVFCGRVVEEKGVANLLEATALLLKRLPSTRTLIVGDGQDRPEMEMLSASLGITRAVTFVGWVDPSRVPAYLMAADIFVGPSKTAANGWIEAQGLTILEAMAVETPVIATRSGGIVDSVFDGDTGLLIEEGAPDQIRDAVIRLCTAPDLRARVITKAKEQVTATFSRQTSAQAFNALFEHCIQRHGRGVSDRGHC